MSGLDTSDEVKHGDARGYDGDTTGFIVVATALDLAKVQGFKGEEMNRWDILLLVVILALTLVLLWIGWFLWGDVASVVK